MMGPLCSRWSLQMALSATVYFMVLLTTCDTKECRLQIGENMKDGSAFLTTSDVKLFQIQCMEVSCRQSYGESKIIAKTGGSRDRQENQLQVLKPSCGSKVCNTTSVCLETGCSKKCVEAPSFCDLHMASKTGDLKMMKAILSQGQVDINCKEWNRKTPVVLAAGEGHRDVVHLLVRNGANLSLADDFGINVLHSACLGGDVALVKYVLSFDEHDINVKVLCGATPVMLAAENGHRNVVDLLVGQGANVYLRDATGNNILHFACRGGHVGVVKYVLSQNMVDINSRGCKGMTPMMMAAKNGHRKVVELLVGLGANVSLSDNKGNNILHISCHGGHVEVVNYVLLQDMVDINSRRWKSKTPMMMAAENRHKEVVELLVRSGANVSLTGPGRNNLLHYACRGGDVEVVKYIISLGVVDINGRGRNRKTPMMMAAENRHKEVVELLVRSGASVSLKGLSQNNLLHYACRGRDVEVVKYVLSLGVVDINGRGWKRMTPIMMTAEEGQKLEVVELLVRSGASVSLKGLSQNNLLHYACRGGDVGVVKYVLSLGMVDINGRGWKSMTPIMVAAEEGHKLEMVELLVRNGAKLSLKGRNHNNILHYACRGGDVEVVKYVLSLGMVDINSRGWKSMTPVIMAVNNGYMKVMQLLLRNGADVSLHDNEGNSILHIACRGGHVEVVKYILSKNIVGINSRNREGVTPVMMAAKGKCMEVVEILINKGADRPLEGKKQ